MTELAGESAWERAPVPPAAAALEAAGYPAWQAACLARRGVAEPEAARAFLAPDPGQLSDPEALPGVAAAAARLAAAAAGSERVAIVGDYDVDGVSATALLSAVLELCGAGVEPILPHRMSEGYGFQEVHVERAQAAGCSLVVTVDCGSSAPAPAAAALAAGLDVIVADHHLSAEELPEGVVEINPRRSGAPEGAGALAAAGIAFKLGAAIARRCGRELRQEALLRVACLGTVADMVPLSGENRVIAALGLAALPDTPSPGLRALMARANTRRPLSAADIGFRLGPRINAAGRMARADPALELLLTRDPQRAQELAEELEEHNRERREAQERVEEEARERFLEQEPLPPVLVAWAEGWHRGVVGIAAGRLARELHRPTILLSLDDDRAHGSGRSIPGIELYDFLLPWRHRLQRFGGHSQAIGLSADRGALAELAGEWRAAAAEWPAERLRRRVEYELELAAGELTGELARGLASLGPFGVGNPRPLARVAPLRLCAPPRRFGKGNLELRTVDAEGAEAWLVGWGWEERGELFEEPFEVLGVPVWDRYNERPALRLADARRIAARAGA